MPSPPTENTNLLPDKPMHRSLNPSPSRSSLLRTLAFTVLAVFFIAYSYNALGSAPADAGDGLVMGGTMSSSSGEKMVGGDRDEHGCIGSAGYTYCKGMGKCVRPWTVNMGLC
mgnify:CR=1 FL=1